MSCLLVIGNVKWRFLKLPLSQAIVQLVRISNVPLRLRLRELGFSQPGKKKKESGPHKFSLVVLPYGSSLMIVPSVGFMQCLLIFSFGKYLFCHQDQQEVIDYFVKNIRYY